MVESASPSRDLKKRHRSTSKERYVLLYFIEIIIDFDYLENIVIIVLIVMLVKKNIDIYHQNDQNHPSIYLINLSFYL